MYGGERTFSQVNVDLPGELRNFRGSFLRIGRRLPARTLRLRCGPLFNEEGVRLSKDATELFRSVSEKCTSCKNDEVALVLINLFYTIAIKQ
jgi:hypothetical protein